MTSSTDRFRWLPAFGALPALAFAAIGGLSMAAYFLCIHANALSEIINDAGMEGAGLGAIPGQAATPYVMLALLVGFLALVLWRGAQARHWWQAHRRPIVWPLLFALGGAGFTLATVWVVSAQRAQAQAVHVLEEFSLLQSQLNLPNGQANAWYDKAGNLFPERREAWCSQATPPIDFYVKTMSLPSREGRGMGVVLAQGMLSKLHDNGCLDDKGYLDRLDRLTRSLNAGSGMTDRVMADMAPLPWFGTLAHREQRLRERTLVTPADFCKRVSLGYGPLEAQSYVALSKVCVDQDDKRQVTVKDAEAIRAQLEAIAPRTGAELATSDEPVVDKAEKKPARKASKP